MSLRTLFPLHGYSPIRQSRDLGTKPKMAIDLSARSVMSAHHTTTSAPHRICCSSATSDVRCLPRGDHVSFSLVVSRYFPIFPVLLSFFFPCDSGVISE